MVRDKSLIEKISEYAKASTINFEKAKEKSVESNFKKLRMMRK